MLYIFDVKPQQMRSNQLNLQIRQESFFILCASICLNMSYVTSTILTTVDCNKSDGLSSNSYDWLVFKRIIFNILSQYAIYKFISYAVSWMKNVSVCCMRIRYKSRAVYVYFLSNFPWQRRNISYDIHLMFISATHA